MVIPTSHGIPEGTLSSKSFSEIHVQAYAVFFFNIVGFKRRLCRVSSKFALSYGSIGFEGWWLGRFMVWEIMFCQDTRTWTHNFKVVFLGPLGPFGRECPKNCYA